MCFLILVVLLITSIKLIFVEGDGGLLIGNIFFILSAVYLLIGIKYEKIVYKNGTLGKKNNFGKIKVFKFDDVIRVKYQMSNGSVRVLLYTKNNKKLEIHSFHTNFD